MRLRTSVLFAGLLATMAVAIPSAAFADSFSSVIVYGDSLSDNGNLYSYTGMPTSPPYYMGRFSNGPVAVEQLAALLGVPLFDFAFGGATSGIGNYGDGGTQTSVGAHGLPGMQEELGFSAPLLASPLVSTSLFVVWGGANDFLTNGSPLVAAANIDGIVSTLEADGATHILVPGIPDLGLTPDFYGYAPATAYANAFNDALLAGLPAGATYVNTFALLDSIVANPGAYGITNTTAPCFNGVSVCPDPSDYLFWDGFHPTTTVDSVVAADFLQATTPEPSALVLLGTGAAGLVMRLRRKKA